MSCLMSPPAAANASCNDTRVHASCGVSRPAVGVRQPFSDEAVLSVAALTQLARELDRAVEVTRHVGVGNVAAGIDGKAVVQVAPEPDAVVVLEAEADRIEHDVARAARVVVAVLLEALSGRDARRGLGDRWYARRADREPVLQSMLL